MVKNGVISESKKAELSKLPIKLDFRPESHSAQGSATYFREYLRDYMKKWVKDHLKSDGTEYDLYRDGLKIYTTIDSKMQQYAEEAVYEHLKIFKKNF